MKSHFFKKSILPVLLLAGLPVCLAAQGFGGHPPGLRWQQINTPYVRVIFPKGMEAPAERTANLIHSIHDEHRRSVGNQSEKIDLVIQNQTVIPNGYVGLAPFRSEFFATPPQNPNLLGSLDWIDVLAVHEYRHALQLVNADRGFTTLLRTLFGEQGWAIGVNLSIPSWFWEGDAVVTETALTNAGRGRLPAFTLEQRAILSEGRKDSYMKARNGSWKSLVPSHYTLGYSLCNYGREQFGNDIWKDVLKDAGAYRGIFYPFSRALRRHTGLSTRKLYFKTYDSLAKDWRLQQRQMTSTRFTKINQVKKRQATNYTFPRPLSDGNIACVREGFDKIAALVALSPRGEERELTTQGIVVDNYISVVNDKIAWSEIETHLRWSNVFYSVIVAYDYKTGRKERLTSKSKYFSPAFSHSGDKIAAVHISENQENEIRLLEANTGEVLQTLPNPGNHFLMYPQWTDDDQAIVFIDKRQGEMALLLFDLSEGTTTELTPYTAHVVNTPYVQGDWVFFSASFSGIDNIYALSLSDRSIRQAASAKVGMAQPAVSADGESLYFSNFTVMGYDLGRIPIDFSQWPNIAWKEPVEMYNTEALRPEGGNILADVRQENYEVDNYSPLFGGMKLHSWTYESTSPQSIAIVGLLNNVLNTSAMRLSLGRNFNEDKTELSAAYRYGGLFPALKLEGAYTSRSSRLLESQKLQILNFEETRVGGGLSLPLQWYRGAYSSGLEISAMAFYRDVDNFKKGTSPAYLEGFSFVNMDLELAAYRLRKKAPQQIYPRFGQVVRMGYQQSIKRRDIGRQWALARLYLPGLLSTHSVALEADYRREELANPYQFGDIFNYARGYGIPYADKIWRLSANYHFPITYPDWGFGGLIYFRRVRGNVFFDESRYWRFGERNEQRSVGGELILDTQWLNLPPVLSWGGRCTLPLKKQGGSSEKFIYEIFLETNL